MVKCAWEQRIRTLDLCTLLLAGLRGNGMGESYLLIMYTVCEPLFNTCFLPPLDVSTEVTLCASKIIQGVEMVRKGFEPGPVREWHGKN